MSTGRDRSVEGNIYLFAFSDCSDLVLILDIYQSKSTRREPSVNGNFKI